MIKNFSELFNINGRSITSKAAINIKGVTVGPGVSLGSGGYFGRINPAKFIGRNFEVEISNGVYFVKRVADPI